MRVDVTFILPTLNRRQWVKRALGSCLACEDDSIKPRVIVIESQSDDDTFGYLQEHYDKDDRVTLCQNDRSAGCVESWLQGAELVRTHLAAFMFDDDVLSPFFREMVANMMRLDVDFIMGRGAVCDINQVYDFKPIRDFNTYDRSSLLLGYYGIGDDSKLPFLPVSPICCVITNDLLGVWAHQVRTFAAKNSFRRYFMLERGIGPDLMIYLTAMLRGRGPLVTTPSVVAQFSAHPNSISIRSRQWDLRVGYWLARVWGFEYFWEAGDRKEVARCAAYVLSAGIVLALEQLASFNASFVREIIAETRTAFSRIRTRGQVLSTIFCALDLMRYAMVRRLKRARTSLSPFRR